MTPNPKQESRGIHHKINSPKTEITTQRTSCQIHHKARNLSYSPQSKTHHKAKLTTKQNSPQIHHNTSLTT
jgi:hypothetical protein